MKIYEVRYYPDSKEEEMWILIKFLETLADLGNWSTPWTVIVKSHRQNNWMYIVEPVCNDDMP